MSDWNGDTGHQDQQQNAEGSTQAANLDIRAAITPLTSLLAGSETAFRTVAYQAISNVMVLALNNAVAEQQQAQIVRLSMTSAAANAILEGRKDEALELMRLTRSLAPSMSDLVREMRECLQFVREELTPAAAAQAASTPVPSSSREHGNEPHREQNREQSQEHNPNQEQHGY